MNYDPKDLQFELLNAVSQAWLAAPPDERESLHSACFELWNHCRNGNDPHELNGRSLFDCLVTVIETRAASQAFHFEVKRRTGNLVRVYIWKMRPKLRVYCFEGAA